eukprot:TRINITY_DN778421_c0_g1_i1.p1 TRINITY_DN778421_c0_g1~~TRINITY_DN778421_c0_g1_i1.p1  ORF type:complete len:231 (-),score=66.23 TRINITY_DN778421_c0_g1_i1:39-731(-)
MDPNDEFHKIEVSHFHERLDQLKGLPEHVPSMQTLNQRLATLKGVDPKTVSVSNPFKPSEQPSTADQLIQQTMESLNIESGGTLVNTTRKDNVMRADTDPRDNIAAILQSMNESTGPMTSIQNEVASINVKVPTHLRKEAETINYDDLEDEFEEDGDINFVDSKAVKQMIAQVKDDVRLEKKYPGFAKLKDEEDRKEMEEYAQMEKRGYYEDSDSESDITESSDFDDSDY